MVPTAAARRLSAAAVALTGFLAVVFALRPIDDFDVWYHLNAGRLMAATWRWPTTNTFAYTAPDYPWIDLHWLFQLLLYGAWRLAGPNGCIALTALLLLVTVGILYLGARRFAPDALVALLITVALVIASARFVPRPEMLSFVLLATYLYLLDGYPGNGTAIFWLIPLQVVWTNSQGIFAVGLAVIGCYWAGATAAFLPVPRSWRAVYRLRPAEWRRLTLVLVAACVVCFLNPYGWQGVMFPIELLPRVTGSSLFSGRIGEFRGPFASGYAVPLAYTWATMLVLTALSFVVSVRRWHLGRLLAAAAFGWLSTQALRNVALFAWIAVPVVAANLGPLLGGRAAAAAGAGGTRRRQADDAAPGAPPRGMLLPTLGAGAVVVGLVLLIAFVATNRFARALDVEREVGLGVSPLHFPLAAEQFARDAGITGRPFNDLAIGGYLGWRRFPQERVFVDGRLEVYPEDFFRFYFAALDNPNMWPTVVQRYAPDYAILYHVWSNRHPLARYLRAGHGWVLVYWDETASIYLPTDDAHRAMRERAGLAFADLRAHRAPPSVPSAFWRRVSIPVAALRRDSAYGDFLLAIGETADAAEAFKRALTIEPGIALIQINLGVAYWSSGHPSEALVEWRDVLRRDPGNERVRGIIEDAERRLNVP
ncbi:MAG TPA: tetratricopeptide repeat protein [Candidatus Binatia bacterium]|jgi:tetratricopeptide (TPR) repeat protein